MKAAKMVYSIFLGGGQNENLWDVATSLVSENIYRHPLRIANANAAARLL